MVFFRDIWRSLQSVVSFDGTKKSFFPSDEFLTGMANAMIRVLSPWSPSAHHFYPQDFRENVFGFLLLAKRIGLYRDVRMMIVRCIAQLYLECALKDWGKTMLTFLVIKK
jgi:hypothetical protein